MEYGDRYKEFEQYLASREPGVEERARNWSMTIGLQDVDRLTQSEFLLEQAKANIEGRISTDELRYILDPEDICGPGCINETFRVLKERELREYGEYRTRRLVLDAWHRFNYHN